MSVEKNVNHTDSEINGTKGQCNYDNGKHIVPMVDTRHKTEFHRMKEERITSAPSLMVKTSYPPYVGAATLKTLANACRGRKEKKKFDL